ELHDQVGVTPSRPYPPPQPLSPPGTEPRGAPPALRSSPEGGAPSGKGAGRKTVGRGVRAADHPSGRRAGEREPGASGRGRPAAVDPYRSGAAHRCRPADRDRMGRRGSTGEAVPTAPSPHRPIGTPGPARRRYRGDRGAAPTRQGRRGTGSASVLAPAGAAPVQGRPSRRPAGSR